MKNKIFSALVVIAFGFTGCGGGGGDSSSSNSTPDIVYYGSKSGINFESASDWFSNYYHDNIYYFDLSDGCGQTAYWRDSTEFYIYRDGTASTYYKTSNGSYATDYCYIENIFIKTTSLPQSYTDVNGTYINEYTFNSNIYDVTINTEYVGNDIAATSGVVESSINLQSLRAVGDYIKADISWHNSDSNQDYNTTVNVVGIAEKVSFEDAGLQVN